jgi:hypothetical protein
MRFVESKGMAESARIQRTDAPAKFVYDFACFVGPPNSGTNWPLAVMPTQPLAQRKHIAEACMSSSPSSARGRGGRPKPTSRKILTTGSQSVPSQCGQWTSAINPPFERRSLWR